MLPYAQTSFLIDAVISSSIAGITSTEIWQHHNFSDLSYDKRFCYLLRAGVEDALVVLLLALLDNIRDLSVRRISWSLHNLPWKAKFTVIGRFLAHSYDPWLLKQFEQIPDLKQLEVLNAAGASSGYQHANDAEEIGQPFFPVQRLALSTKLYALHTLIPCSKFALSLKAFAMPLAPMGTVPYVRIHLVCSGSLSLSKIPSRTCLSI